MMLRMIEETSDVIVMLKRHHIMSHLSVFRYFWGPFFKYTNALFKGMQEKIHYLCAGGIEKSPFVITRQGL